MSRGIFPDQGLNTCPCIGRQILNHWTTREVPRSLELLHPLLWLLENQLLLQQVLQGVGLRGGHLLRMGLWPAEESPDSPDCPHSAHSRQLGLKDLMFRRESERAAAGHKYSWREVRT